MPISLKPQKCLFRLALLIYENSSLLSHLIPMVKKKGVPLQADAQAFKPNPAGSVN